MQEVTHPLRYEMQSHQGVVGLRSQGLARARSSKAAAAECGTWGHMRHSAVCLGLDVLIPNNSGQPKVCHLNSQCRSVQADPIRYSCHVPRHGPCRCSHEGLRCQAHGLPTTHSRASGRYAECSCNHGPGHEGAGWQS